MEEIENVSESEEEDEEEEDEEEEVEIEDVEEVEIKDYEPEIKMIQLPKTTVSDDDVSEFDGLSLKELKEKVAELEGPKLKTKKECIDFLKIKSKKEL